MSTFLYRVGFISCTHLVELVTVWDGVDSVYVISESLVVHCPGLWLSIVCIHYQIHRSALLPNNEPT